jgi:hypothetical protein
MEKILPLILAGTLMAVPAFAEDKKPEPASAPPSAPVAVETEKAPDTSNILFIQNLRKAGTTIYYLGEALGMHGWFAMKDGQVQIFYTSQDQRALLVGALLSAEGANISQQQIALLANDKPEVMEAMKQMGGAPEQSASAPPSKPPSAEEIYAQLSKADQVSFGKENAPTLLMIMDVNCEYCHHTWKKLEKPVEEGKLRITMVPIAALGAASLQQGAVWLASANPQETWKKHVAGDKKVLEGAADPKKQEAIARTTQMVVNWKVDQTPYLLYRGVQGKLRLVVGEPKDANVILNDISKDKK